MSSALPPDDWDASLLARAARFAPDPEVARRLAGLGAWPDVSDYDALLGTARLSEVWAGLSFRRQLPRGRRARRAGEAPPEYNASIEAGVVPTRERSWHDLFNALIWAAMPAAKRALHRQQRAAIEERRGSTDGRRSRREDALAMLDEGGLVLASLPDHAPALDGALRRGDRGAIEAMVARGEARGVVFGHALLEHLARGQAARGFVAVTAVGELSVGAIDEALVAVVQRVGPPGEHPGMEVTAPLLGSSR